MTLPTLPTNPQPIDYEIEKFVVCISSGRIRFVTLEIDFMDVPYYKAVELLEEEVLPKAQSAIDELYARVRPHFQAFADALAQQPIEVEPLVWKKINGQYRCDTLVTTYMVYKEDGEWVSDCDMDTQPHRTKEDAIGRCQQDHLDALSKLLKRPVIVKQNPNTNQDDTTNRPH